jgi:hypothetical protein
MLHESYKRRMLEHFLTAIDSAANGLKLDLSHVRQRIEGLAPSQRLSPCVYAALTRLSGALQSGKITDVFDSLQGIWTTPDEELLDTRFRMSSVLTESWEESFIQTARNEPAEGLDENAKIIRPLLQADPSYKFTPAFAALETLKRVDPELSAVFYEYVSRIKLFSGRGYLGFSSPAAFGAIFMRLPDERPVEYFLEHLVHELSHLDLNVLMAHDPLLENPLDRHEAPLREEQRPLFQILHATYVLSRNVRVARRLVGDRDLDCEEDLEGFEKSYARGYRVVEAHAKLTPMGERLLESLEPLN